MNKKKRKKLPPEETKVLFKNRYCCCICGYNSKGKDVIIHHIDGNPNNTTQENLAVLCLDHASQADAGLRKGKLGSGRKLTPELVKKFKKDWEERVSKEFKIEKKILPIKKRKHLEILYEFEFTKIKNEILASPGKKQKFIKQKFDFLAQFLVEEFISGIPFRKLLLKIFNDIAIISPQQDYINIPLIESIRNLHIHLIGPEEVPMGKNDKTMLFRSLETLETIGSYEASLNDTNNTLKEVCKTIIELSEMASWYEFHKFIKKAKQVLLKIKKESEQYGSPEIGLKERKKRIQSKILIINKALNRISNLLK